MANKRNLKKAIRYACGDIAGECIFIEEAVSLAEVEAWDQIILDVALIQEEALNRVSVSYDKVPKDFADKREYRKARRAYFRAVAKGINNYMQEQFEEVVKAMNALTPKTA